MCVWCVVCVCVCGVCVCVCGVFVCVCTTNFNAHRPTQTRKRELQSVINLFAPEFYI